MRSGSSRLVGRDTEGASERASEGGREAGRQEGKGTFDDRCPTFASAKGSTTQNLFHPGTPVVQSRTPVFSTSTHAHTAIKGK